MEESPELENKNWGEPCPDCQGRGINPVGGRCLNCSGYGRVGSTRFDAPQAVIETESESITRRVHRQVTIDGARIDLRGKAGQIVQAAPHALGLDIDLTIRDMHSENPGDRKGAYMHGRLILRVRTNLNQELPEHYQKLVHALTNYTYLPMGITPQPPMGPYIERDHSHIHRESKERRFFD